MHRSGTCMHKVMPVYSFAVHLHLQTRCSYHFLRFLCLINHHFVMYIPGMLQSSAKFGTTIEEGVGPCCLQAAELDTAAVVHRHAARPCLQRCGSLHLGAHGAQRGDVDAQPPLCGKAHRQRTQVRLKGAEICLGAGCWMQLLQIGICMHLLAGADLVTFSCNLHSAMHNPSAACSLAMQWQSRLPSLDIQMLNEQPLISCRNPASRVVLGCRAQPYDVDVEPQPRAPDAGPGRWGAPPPPPPPPPPPQQVGVGEAKYLDRVMRDT